MDQEEHSVHFGHPGRHTGPLITIYEEVFADVIDDLACLSDHPVNEDILTEIGGLVVKSLGIYDSASERENVMSPLIESLLGVKLTSDAHTSISPLEAKKSDAIIPENGAIYLHLECRNELELGGMADFQGLGPHTLLKHIAEPEVCRSPFS